MKRCMSANGGELFAHNEVMTNVMVDYSSTMKVAIISAPLLSCRNTDKKVLNCCDFVVHAK